MAFVPGALLLAALAISPMAPSLGRAAETGLSALAFGGTWSPLLAGAGSVLESVSRDSATGRFGSDPSALGSVGGVRRFTGPAGPGVAATAPGDSGEAGGPDLVAELELPDLAELLDPDGPALPPTLEDLAAHAGKLVEPLPGIAESAVEEIVADAAPLAGSLIAAVGPALPPIPADTSAPASLALPDPGALVRSEEEPVRIDLLASLHPDDFADPDGTAVEGASDPDLDGSASLEDLVGDPDGIGGDFDDLTGGLDGLAELGDALDGLEDLGEVVDGGLGDLGDTLDDLGDTL